MRVPQFALPRWRLPSGIVLGGCAYDMYGDPTATDTAPTAASPSGSVTAAAMAAGTAATVTATAAITAAMAATATATAATTRSAGTATIIIRAPASTSTIATARATVGTTTSAAIGRARRERWQHHQRHDEHDRRELERLGPVALAQSTTSGRHLGRDSNWQRPARRRRTAASGYAVPTAGRARQHRGDGARQSRRLGRSGLVPAGGGSGRSR